MQLLLNANPRNNVVAGSGTNCVVAQPTESQRWANVERREVPAEHSEDVEYKVVANSRVDFSHSRCYMRNSLAGGESTVKSCSTFSLVEFVDDYSHDLCKQLTAS